MNPILLLNFLFGFHFLWSSGSLFFILSNADIFPPSHSKKKKKESNACDSIFMVDHEHSNCPAEISGLECIDSAEIRRNSPIQILDFHPKSINIYILPPRQGRGVTKSCDPYI